MDRVAIRTAGAARLSDHSRLGRCTRSFGGNGSKSATLTVLGILRLAAYCDDRVPLFTFARSIDGEPRLLRRPMDSSRTAQAAHVDSGQRRRFLLAVARSPSWRSAS